MEKYGDYNGIGTMQIGGEWQAYLVCDKNVRETGHTEAEAVGKLYIKASKQIAADIIEIYEYAEAEKSRRSAAIDELYAHRLLDDDTHRLAKEAQEAAQS